MSPTDTFSTVLEPEISETAPQSSIGLLGVLYTLIRLAGMGIVWFIGVVAGIMGCDQSCSVAYQWFIYVGAAPFVVTAAALLMGVLLYVVQDAAERKLFSFDIQDFIRRTYRFLGKAAFGPIIATLCYFVFSALYSFVG